jgi:hypothetical protein
LDLPFVSRWACATFVSEFRFRSGSPIYLAFAVFLLERHGGKFFVELEPLIVLFHVGPDFLFCFTSDLRGFLLELPFYFLSADTETMALSSRGF